MRRAMARKRIEVEAGSGNVFTDLGNPDARERIPKVELAMEVNRILGERGLAQDRAAKLLGIRQPRVSDLLRYEWSPVEGFRLQVASRDPASLHTEPSRAENTASQTPGAQAWKSFRAF